MAAQNIVDKRIRKNFNQLTKSSQKIAEFLVSNMEDAAFLDSSDLGRKIGVSESTVIRFAKAIGYEGFPKMQGDLRIWLKEQITPAKKMEKSRFKTVPNLSSTIIDNDITNLKNLSEELKYENLENAVGMILKARRLYIIGYRTSFPLAHLLNMLLSQIMQNVELIDLGGGVIYDRIWRWSKDDVLIAFSFPRYSRVTLEFVEFARSKKCKIIGITDNLLSPLGKMADIVLTVQCGSPMFFNSYISAVCLINCLTGEASVKMEKKSIHLLRNRDKGLRQLGVLLE